MKKFLVDANLPIKVSSWESEIFEFVSLINQEFSDGEIWNYAKQRNLTIVTKDADFSHRIMTSSPPPKIIHIKIGNLRLREFKALIEKLWPLAEEISSTHKLVNVFPDRIEGVE